MSTSQQKVLQYLNEAHAMEHALTRELQAQIAMTPGGSYRTGLAAHLAETRRHAERVGRRLEELDPGSNPVITALGAVGGAVGHVLALGKAPFNLLRGAGGEEKVLKNAKDACAAEALEIATYTALVRLATAFEDEVTATLAASILAEEERMLARVMREIPKLTDAVVRAEVKGKPSYDVTKTGAADAVKDAARTTGAAAKRTARQSRKVPGVAGVEGEIKGALASEGDVAIARYDTLTAEEIAGRLADLSQIDLAKIDAYERKGQNRATVLSRITSLQGSEPWPGYDELTVGEVQAVVSDGDDERAGQVREYERAHKNRAGVLKTAQREPATA